MIIIQFSHSCVGNQPQLKATQPIPSLETVRNGWKNEMILHDLLSTKTITQPKLEGNVSQKPSSQTKNPNSTHTGKEVTVFRIVESY